MQLLLDENVSERLIDALTNHGLDAISANREYKGTGEEMLLLIAAILNRTLLTYNTTDFALLHRAWTSWSTAWNPDRPQTHAGILLIHSAPGFGSTQVAESVVRFATSFAQGTSVANRAFSLFSARGWDELH
jgi:hypothetical protein